MKTKQIERALEAAFREAMQAAAAHPVDDSYSPVDVYRQKLREAIEVLQRSDRTPPNSIEAYGRRWTEAQNRRAKKLELILELEYGEARTQ